MSRTDTSTYICDRWGCLDTVQMDYTDGGTLPDGWIVIEWATRTIGGGTAGYIETRLVCLEHRKEVERLLSEFKDEE